MGNNTTNETLAAMMRELQRMFKILNDKYYEGALPEPLILIQTTGKQSRYGWFTARYWKNRSTEEILNEINICPEFLYRTAVDICETLLHEMVHLYAFQNDIKETSRGGTYHNKKYKTIAIEHGLCCEKHEQKGYTLTSLTDDARSFISEHVNASALCLVRGTLEDDEDDDMDAVDAEKEKEKAAKKAAKKTNGAKIKQVCPQCNYQVKTADTHRLICGVCNVALIAEQPKQRKKKKDEGEDSQSDAMQNDTTTNSEKEGNIVQTKSNTNNEEVGQKDVFAPDVMQESDIANAPAKAFDMTDEEDIAVSVWDDVEDSYEFDDNNY